MNYEWLHWSGLKTTATKAKSLGMKRQNKKNCSEFFFFFYNIHHRNRFSYLYHIEEEKGEDDQQCVCEFVVFSRSVFCPPSPRDTKQPSPPLSLMWLHALMALSDQMYGTLPLASRPVLITLIWGLGQITHDRAASEQLIHLTRSPQCSPNRLSCQLTLTISRMCHIHH